MFILEGKRGERNAFCRFIKIKQEHRFLYLVFEIDR
jgi:hypothetical protein